MFSIVLKACAGLATERHALAVQSHVLKVEFEDDTVVANALIHACARYGSIALSKQAFDEMGSRDTVFWNSMLKAYAMHGRGKEALQLFSRMDAQPDGATFVALLSACSHAGIVEEGTKIIETMANNHGIVPQLDHYACMVDVLGLVGWISKAKELIHKMQMEPDSVVWSAFFGGCRKHGETKLAKLAAAKLKELDPNNSSGYVLMSHIFSTDGHFNEAGLIREHMFANYLFVKQTTHEGFINMRSKSYTFKQDFVKRTYVLSIERHHSLNRETNVVIPGCHGLPGWVSHKSIGHEISIELPKNWYEHKTSLDLLYSAIMFHSMMMMSIYARQ